jgi:hypothetical protein
MTINLEIEYKYVNTICGTSGNDVNSTPSNHPFFISSMLATIINNNKWIFST